MHDVMFVTELPLIRNIYDKYSPSYIFQDSNRPVVLCSWVFHVV